LTTAGSIDDPPGSDAFVTINQSINQFICPEINTHWTGHQGRTQPPLTGAHKGLEWERCI